MPDAISIKRLTTISEYKLCEVLQQTIWGAAPIEVTPADLLITIHRHGGLVLGAFDERDVLIGFLFGLPGITAPDNPAAGKAGAVHHCSHALGVIPEWQGKGVGFQLKLAQREWLLARGIRLVTWTYDPLEAGNAVLNIGKLGAVCRCYLRDLYGAMPDALNAGMPSDRFEVSWWLDSQRVLMRVERGWSPPDFAELVARGVPALRFSSAAKEVGTLLSEGNSPATHSALVEIPRSIQELKRERPAEALSWRMFLRAVLETLFARGFEIGDIVEESAGHGGSLFYLLQHVPRQT